jgi:hypothetical protein
MAQKPIDLSGWAAELINRLNAAEVAGSSAISAVMVAAQELPDRNERSKTE